jgi:hypothetical protein
MRSIHRVAVVFVILGVVMASAAGFWALRKQAFLSRAHHVTGTVIDVDASRSSSSHRSVTYHPVVRFELAGGEAHVFRGTVGTNPSSFSVGDAVDVAYDPADPRHAELDTISEQWMGPLVVGGLGALFATIGAVILLVRRASARRAASLRSRGRAIVTRLQEVERNTSLTVNGRSPWRIVTRWQDPATGLVHLFRSENLWFDPTPYLDRKELTVFVDAANYGRHHVDVSFLPKLVA